jgi:type IV pilus assembly protein PilM
MAFLSFGRVKDAAMQTINGSTLPIAVDFGVSALKVLQLSSGDTPTLIAAAGLETPDALLHDAAKRFTFQCQALPRLIKAGKFKGKRAVCAIPAEQMFCKHMQFPRSDGGALEEQVRTSVPAALNVPAEAVVLRHFAVEGAQAAGSSHAGGSAGGVKQEVICLAVSRELVGRMMDAIRASRLEPVGIHPECIATLRAFDHINRRVADEHLTTLYLDIASGTTKVWITHGSNLVFAKVIHFGGRDLDQTVARAMDLRLSEARAKRLAASVLVVPAATPGSGMIGACGQGQTSAGGTAGPAGTASAGGPGHSFLTTIGAAAGSTVTSEDRRIGQIAPGLTPSVMHQDLAPIGPEEFDLQAPLENLTDEVAMCLRYYESMFPGRRVERAVFYGGEARHRGLCQLIAKRVRCSTHVADPVARIARTGKEPCMGVDFTTPQPGWTIAFGLSLCPTEL